MGKLMGGGLASLHTGGTLFEEELGAGATFKFDTGCLVALTPAVNYDIEFAGGTKRAWFGGDDLFLATPTGAGHVWPLSQHLLRLANRINTAASLVVGQEKAKIRCCPEPWAQF